MKENISRRTALKWSLSAATLAHMGNLQAAPTNHQLPSLPYQIDDLEPHIDAKTMSIHHSKHHAAYITKLNEILATQEAMSQLSIDDLMKKLGSISDLNLQTALRNQGGGHWNHRFFWQTMAPEKKTGKPSKELLASIDENFGSLDALKQAFTDTAMKRFGSGWAWLILQKGQLKITSTANQDNPLMQGCLPDAECGSPLLGVDVWEHAYYLHYQNRRVDYLQAWWNVVDWNAVNQRYMAHLQQS